MDKKDIRILELLSVNCRYSIKDIARATLLSKDAVKYRINNLIKNQLIYKFLTLINFSAFGYDQYYINIQLQNISPKKEQLIIAKLTKNPNIFFLVKTSGRWDFFLGMTCKNVQQFDKTLRKVYEILGQNLADSESVVWLKDYKYTHTIEGIKLNTKLNYKNRDPSFSKELFSKKKEFKIRKISLKEKDLEILKHFSENPRIELKALGQKVKLTGEAARYRIKNLIEKEIILGFTAVPNFFNLGYQTHFLLIQAKNLTTENEKLLEKFLQEKDYTIISFKTIGKFDILISLSVKDLNEFDLALTEIRNKLSPIIKTYETMPILAWYKYTLFPETLYKTAEKF
ncbi:MAG: Lrp/AsnC family transcriptional regulator [Nanoarchaeota archaeon]